MQTLIRDVHFLKKKCKFFLNVSFYLVSRHLNCVLKINFGEVALGRLL